MGQLPSTYENARTAFIDANGVSMTYRSIGPISAVPLLCLLHFTEDRGQLKQHLSQVKFMEGDLLLLDRGYPSISLMFQLQQRRIGFCMRLKGEWWLETQKMLLSGQRDKVVTFKLPRKDAEWIY